MKTLTTVTLVLSAIFISVGMCLWVYDIVHDLAITSSFFVLLTAVGGGHAG